MCSKIIDDANVFSYVYITVNTRLYLVFYI